MKPLPAELNTSATLHGLSAFATLQTRHGQPLLVAEHLARLADTCTLLSLPPPETGLPVLEDFPWGLLRLTVTAEGTFYGHRPLPTPAVPAGGVSVWLGRLQVHPQLGRQDRQLSAVPAGGSGSADAGRFRGAAERPPGPRDRRVAQWPAASAR